MGQYASSERTIVRSCKPAEYPISYPTQSQYPAEVSEYPPEILEYPIGWRMQKGPCMPIRGWEIDAVPGKQSIHINPDCYKTDP